MVSPLHNLHTYSTWAPFTEPFRESRRVYKAIIHDHSDSQVNYNVNRISHIIMRFAVKNTIRKNNKKVSEVNSKITKSNKSQTAI